MYIYYNNNNNNNNNNNIYIYIYIYMCPVTRKGNYPTKEKFREIRLNRSTKFKVEFLTELVNA